MDYDYGDNKQKIISIRISDTMFDNITSISKDFGISNSKFIRLLLESYFESLKNNKGV